MKYRAKNLSILIFTLCFLVLNFYVKSEALNIILDPGHGGDARGCFHEYDGVVIEEKDLNLKIASFIKDELNKYQTKSGSSVGVFLTRGQFDNPTLQERVAIGIQKNANVIISLHNNASNDEMGKYRGAMALVTSSHFNNKYDIEEALSKHILNELKQLGVSISHDTISGIADNDDGLLRRLADNGDTYPNGEIADWYGIIMHGILNNIPSILIEHAYLDNEEDYRQFLCTDDKLRQIAMADVKGIVNYYGLVVKNIKPENVDDKRVEQKNSDINKSQKCESFEKNQVEIKKDVADKTDVKMVTQNYETVKEAEINEDNGASTTIEQNKAVGDNLDYISILKKVDVFRKYGQLFLAILIGIVVFGFNKKSIK